MSADQDLVVYDYENTGAAQPGVTTGWRAGRIEAAPSGAQSVLVVYDYERVT